METRRGDDPMSQHAMEQMLGKLVMDGEFRDAFFRDPAEASREAEIELSGDELDMLARIPPGALGAFKRYLDRKLASGGGAEDPDYQVSLGGTARRVGMGARARRSTL
jgi:hypothetical protein